jgi:peptidoglycan/xylan/chitin deacetylase (PgdA/CDA1 family)
MAGLTKELAIICSAGLIHFSGLAILTRHLTRSRIPILTYHSVSDAGDSRPSCLDLTRMRVAPAEFRKQMEHVARHYNTVTLRDVVRARRGEAPLPAHPCVITFDDGYVDGYETVAPVLEELGLTATFFVVGRITKKGELPWLHAVHDILDTAPPARCAAAFHKAAPNIFDGRAAIKEELCSLVLRYFHEHDRPTRARFLEAVLVDLNDDAPQSRRFLDARQIRELHERGFEIGCHSMEHECMARLGDAELHADIRQCKEVLEEILGRPSQTFCYPFGWHRSFDDRVIDTLKRENFACAVTTIPGLNDLSTDPFVLRRIMVYTDTTLPIFVFRLLGLEAQSRRMYGSFRSAFRGSELTTNPTLDGPGSETEYRELPRSPWG